MGSLNWGDLVKDAASGSNFEPLPDGDYDFRVVEAPATTTSGGKTMFKLKAEVQGGPFNKRLVWDNLVVSPENPNALGFFFRKMNALGLGAEFFSTQPTNAQIETALKDRRFRGQVGSRPYNGEKRNEIKNYYPVAAGATPGAPIQAAAPTAAPAPAPAPQAAPAPEAGAAPAATNPWEQGGAVAPPPAPPF